MGTLRWNVLHLFLIHFYHKSLHSSVAQTYSFFVLFVFSCNQEITILPVCTAVMLTSKCPNQLVSYPLYTCPFVFLIFPMDGNHSWCLMQQTNQQTLLMTTNNLAVQNFKLTAKCFPLNHIFPNYWVCVAWGSSFCRTIQQTLASHIDWVNVCSSHAIPRQHKWLWHWKS